MSDREHELIAQEIAVAYQRLYDRLALCPDHHENTTGRCIVCVAEERAAQKWRAENAALHARLIDEHATAHGLGQEHAVADVNAGLVDDLIAPRLEKLLAETAALRAERDDYKQVADDARRLARLIDVAMYGEEGAAKQASLCDLVRPAQKMAARLAALEEALSALERDWRNRNRTSSGPQPQMWQWHLLKCADELAALRARLTPEPKS